MEVEISNQIYRMNEAEGIFFPAFDKHICDDSQMSMEGGRIERIWDSLTFREASLYRSLARRNGAWRI